MIKPRKKNLSVYQRIMAASRRGKGIRLSVDDVEMLTVWDDLIPTQAHKDDDVAKPLPPGMHRSSTGEVGHICEYDNDRCKFCRMPDIGY